MFRKFLRWPFLLLFAALLLAILIPTLSLFHAGKPEAAHAVGSGGNPAISASASVSNGKPFNLHIQGFAASELVQMSWDGNGGQFLGFLHVDPTGGAFNCVKNVAAYFDCLVPPPTLSGSYTLTAIGSTSRLQASTTIKVVPGIALSPNTAGPGSTIQIIGGGFAAGAALTAYFQSPSNKKLAITADKNGFFVQTLSIPTAYDPQASYFIHITNAQGVDLVKEPFSFAPTTITTSLATVTQGVPVNISGKGFLAGESVNVYWNYQQPGQQLVGTATANSYGSFFLPVTTPDVPDPGSIVLAAIGQNSNMQATTSITQQVALVFTPAQGVVGSKFQISGGGFAANEKITISSQKTLLTTVTSDANGAFISTYTIPANTPFGILQIQARGMKSGAILNAQFTVLPDLSITPAAGFSGTTITVTGQNYAKNSQVDIYWYDPTPVIMTTPTVTVTPATSATPTTPTPDNTPVVDVATVTPTTVTITPTATPVQTLLISVKTNANGGFTATIKAPAGLISGNSYSVQTRDATTQILTQVSFSVQ